MRQLSRMFFGVAIALVWTRPGIAEGQNAAAAAALVEKGRYLATAANCGGCHSRDGGDPYSGGVVFNTPFGTIYSTNISPDTVAGIGNWSLSQFKTALREGIRPDGVRLYPAFPYTAFAKLNDEDIDAIFAFLRTQPSSRYRPPKNELNVLARQRWTMTLWNALYLNGETLSFVPTYSPEWHRGRYLIEALGHCGACHSPRNFLGAEKVHAALTGGTYLDKVPGGRIRAWSAVNLTPAVDGLGAWSADDIVTYLKSGHNRFATSFGPMNDVITKSTRHLTDADLRAMAVYLKELPVRESRSTSVADEKVLRSGLQVYTVQCGTCHLPTGMGAVETGPALVGNPVVLAADPASLINLVLYGPELPNPPPPLQRMHMDGYAEKLNDKEIAALASYIRNTWGHKAGDVSAKQVAQQR